MICPYCNGAGKIDAKSASVGMMVKAARKRREMTQEQLALRIGCSRGLVALVETGVHTPKITHLRKWAKALNVPVEELVPG